MTYTLNNCISSINQILNYPSITYDDVSAFFDQAIVELNTSLHIGLRLISDQVALYTSRQNENHPNLIIVTDTAYLDELIPSSSSGSPKCYYDTANDTFCVQKNGTYVSTKDAFALYNNLETGVVHIYKAIKYSSDSIIWVETSDNDPLNLDLTEVLPTDWIILFIIPYVCFKYTVRDGDTGQLYSEEFTQGFQQLQQAYNIPSKVYLPSVAQLPAYTQDVKDNLSDLDKYIPTRAISEDMKSEDITKAAYQTFYDNSGWRF